VELRLEFRLGFNSDPKLRSELGFNKVQTRIQLRPQTKVQAGLKLKGQTGLQLGAHTKGQPELGPEIYPGSSCHKLVTASFVTSGEPIYWRINPKML
jgi:hypothetical protein